MEFCQIQLNYLDWSFQNAKEKVDLLSEYHIPVWVMEPLRGGRLASLSEENSEKLKTLRPDEGIPAWAFRFLQGIPEVKMILSGMSDFAQMQDNIHTFETDKPLNEQEKTALLEIADNMVKHIALPCTACRYCTSHCLRNWIFPCFWSCIMSTALQAADLLRLWLCRPSRRRNSPVRVSDAKAVRRSVRSKLKYQKPWLILRTS